MYSLRQRKRRTVDHLCNITADGMAFASEVKHFFLNVHDICRANLLAHVTWNAMATSCVTY